MRITRIYHDGDLILNTEITLANDAARHIRNVLRMHVNDKLILFNGNGKNYTAKISHMSKQSIIAKILSQELFNTKSSVKIHLAQSIIRNERMDFLIQKVTELGVTEITPLISQYCNVKLNQQHLHKKQDHWQKIAISACEQSGRTDLPIINPINSFSDFLQQDFFGQCYLLTPLAKNSFKQNTDATNITLLLGPEGGFSECEIEQASRKKFRSVSLGSRILRSETASLATVTIAQHLFGDL